MLFLPKEQSRHGIVIRGHPETRFESSKAPPPLLPLLKIASHSGGFAPLLWLFDEKKEKEIRITVTVYLHTCFVLTPSPAQPSPPYWISFLLSLCTGFKFTPPRIAKKGDNRFFDMKKASTFIFARHCHSTLDPVIPEMERAHEICSNFRWSRMQPPTVIE